MKTKTLLDIVVLPLLFPGLPNVDKNCYDYLGICWLLFGDGIVLQNR